MGDSSSNSYGTQGPLPSTAPPYSNWFIYIFVAATLIFFYLKYTNNIDLYMKSPYDSTSRFSSSIFLFLIYFVVIFIFQLSESSINLNRKCTNNVGSNIGHAFLYSIWPWIFIFLFTVALLVFFPRMKKAFSDVIGYFAVYSEVSNIFSKLLYSSAETKQAIEKIGSDKELYEKAGEAIMKMVQDNTLFVNQIEPDTFDKNWDLLKPLIKNDSEDLRKQLFDLVIKRDIIGELCWYLYTGIFVSFIVFYNVTIKSCKKSLAQLQTEFNENVPPPNSGGEITEYSTYDSN